jgi:hypothetical protein
MKIGISVYCAVCKQRKAPRGRSVPDAMWNGMCTWDRCVGYSQDPVVGDLWPGETEEEFGFPVSVHGTRELTSQERARREA